MKKPRVEDFDPNTALPSLGSPLDNLPAIKPPRKEANLDLVVPLEPAQTQHPTTSPSSEEHARQMAAEASGQPDIHPNDPPPVRPTARTPVRRDITRYAFEFFQDQIETLREFSLDEKLRGEKGSMSEMVREALDTYIAHRGRKQSSE